MHQITSPIPWTARCLRSLRVKRRQRNCLEKQGQLSLRQRKVRLRPTRLVRLQVILTHLQIHRTQLQMLHPQLLRLILRHLHLKLQRVQEQRQVRRLKQHPHPETQVAVRHPVPVIQEAIQVVIKAEVIPVLLLQYTAI